jgi:hypothetical protein
MMMMKKKKKKKKKKASSSVSKSMSKKFNKCGSAGRYKWIICLVLVFFAGATYVNTGGSVQVSLKKRLDDIEKLKQRHTKNINDILVHAFDDDEQEELHVVDKTKHDNDIQHANNGHDGSRSKTKARQRSEVAKTLRKRQKKKDVENHLKNLKEVEGNSRNVQNKHDEHIDISKHRYSEHDYTTQAMEIMKSLEKDDTVQSKFVFIAYGNDAFLPFFQNWICNTANMNGVHERTLIITTSESSYKRLNKNRFNVKISYLKLHNTQFNMNLDYDTYGYWKLVQIRVKALGDILSSGASMLLFEPDAIWAQNPLTDPELLNPAFDIIGFSDSSGGIGFGWLLLKSNAKTIALWKEILRLTTLEIDKHKNMKLNSPLHLAGEQQHFNNLIKNKHKYVEFKDIKVKVLSKFKYCSGQWYDGGRGGNGKQYRKQCKQKGIPFVVNNNWIVGNKGKIKRAKRWGHWFLNARNNCDNDDKLMKRLKYATKTFHTLRPKRSPPRDECPKCRR